MEFSSGATFLALIASFLSPLAAAATSGRIERGVISDMAVVGDDQNAGFSGESMMGVGLILHLLRPTPFRGRSLFSRNVSWLLLVARSSSRDSPTSLVIAIGL